MACFNCLPIIEKPFLFTSLEDACYCGALFCVFGLIDYTIGPLSTYAEFCFEQESGWQALIRYYGNLMQAAALALFVASFYYVYGIKKKKRRPIIIFMFFVCTNCLGLLIYSVLLLSINIISSDTECDFPNIKCKDVVVRTSIKIIISLFFVGIYAYLLIVAKSFCLTFSRQSEMLKIYNKEYNTENPPLRIRTSSVSSASPKR